MVRGKSYLIILLVVLFVSCINGNKSINSNGKENEEQWTNVVYKERNVHFVFPEKRYRVKEDTII